MSIKKNFFFSSILTAANYIFPLITYPYVSRVLGVTSIGKFNFIDNVIQCFLIISLLGIGTVGIREIAKSKSNKESLNRIFSSLLIINTITTIIALVILLLSILWVPKFENYKSLLVIGSLKLFSSYLLIDWFYKGIEDFKFITYRTIIIRTIYVISVFLFVKDDQDYNIYYFLLAVSITANAIINLIYAKRYIKFVFDKKTIIYLLKPITYLGAYTILAWLYNSFSTIYLGFVASDEEVGYYTTATKLYNIVLALFTALTGVMLPRLSSLIGEKKHDEFQKMISKNLNVIFSITIPIAIFSIVYSSDIIRLIAGEGYERAALSMRIIMPLVFIIGFEQVLIMQIMMPLKMDKEIMINTICGAIIGIILNLFLVPRLLSVGAAISWVGAEVGVMLAAIYFIRSKTSVKIGFDYVVKTFILVGILGYMLLIIKDISSNYMVRLLVGGITTMLLMIVGQVYFVKNELIASVIKQMVKK